MSLIDAVEQLRTAVRNPGPMPGHHHRIQARHRVEWPKLWEAIDNLLGTPTPDVFEVRNMADEVILTYVLDRSDRGE